MINSVIDWLRLSAEDAVDVSSFVDCKHENVYLENVFLKYIK